MSFLCVLLLASSTTSRIGSTAVRPVPKLTELELQGKEFDPFPNGDSAAFHLDLGRNFFSSARGEENSRINLLTRLRAFASRSNAALRSPAALLQTFKTQDALNQEAIRHLAYHELRFYSDTRNAESMKAATEFRIELANSFNGFDSAAAKLPAATFDAFQRSLPELSKYQFYVEGLRRRASRQLGSEAESVLEAVAPLATDWGPSLYFATLASTDFGVVHTKSLDLSVARDYLAIEANSEAEVRKQGFQKNQAGLFVHRTTYATILARQADALNKLSRQRHYADYAEESYGDRFLDRKSVLNLLQMLAASAGVNKQIEGLINDHIAKVHGLGVVHPWDTMLPEPGMEVPRFTAREAVRIVKEAMKPLGDDYQQELSSLLDPSNGRLDIAPSPNKANRQGFSTGFVGFPSVFFQGRFGGYLDDVVTLAHESGHAVQNMLMTRHGVLPRYATGPAYFTESFAGLCELLVLDYLYAHAPDQAHHAYFLQWLTSQGAEVFRAAWESMLEQEIFDEAAGGKQLNADTIESMTQSSASRFSSWFGPASERTLAWVQPTQFFTRPLYRVNYVYSRLLALNYFQRLRRHPSQFQTRYLGLLCNGYTAAPNALLSRFVDVGLSDQTLVSGAIDMLATWTSELRRVYGE